MLKQSQSDILARAKRVKLKNKTVLPPIAWLRMAPTSESINPLNSALALSVAAVSIVNILIGKIWSKMSNESCNVVKRISRISNDDYRKWRISLNLILTGLILIKTSLLIRDLQIKRKKRLFHYWQEKTLRQSLLWTTNLEDNIKIKKNLKLVKPLCIWNSSSNLYNFNKIYSIIAGSTLVLHSIVPNPKSYFNISCLTIAGVYGMVAGISLLIKASVDQKVINKFKSLYKKSSRNYQSTILKQWKQLSNYSRPLIQDSTNDVINNNSNYKRMNIIDRIHWYAFRSIAPILNIQSIDSLNSKVHESKDYYIKNDNNNTVIMENSDKCNKNPLVPSPETCVIPSRTNRFSFQESQNIMSNITVGELLSMICGLTSFEFKKLAIKEAKEEKEKKNNSSSVDILDRKVHMYQNIGNTVFISLANIGPNFLENPNQAEKRLCFLWSPSTVTKNKSGIGTILWKKSYMCKKDGIRLIPNCTSFIFIGYSYFNSYAECVIEEDLIRLSDGQSIKSIINSFPATASHEALHNFYSAMIRIKRFNSMIGGENDVLSYLYDAHISYDQKWIAFHSQRYVSIYEVDKLLNIPINNVLLNSTIDVVLTPVHCLKFELISPTTMIRSISVIWLHDFNFSTARTEFKGVTYGKAGCWLVSYDSIHWGYDVYLIDGRDGSMIHKWSLAKITSFLQRDLMGYHDSRFALSIKHSCSCNQCLVNSNALCETGYYNIEAWTLSNIAASIHSIPFIPSIFSTFNRNTNINTKIKTEDNKNACLIETIPITIHISRFSRETSEYPITSHKFPKYIWLTHTSLISNVNHNLSLYLSSSSSSFLSFSSFTPVIISNDNNYNFHNNSNNIIKSAHINPHTLFLSEFMIYRPVNVPDDFLYAASEWIAVSMHTYLQGSLDLLAIVFSYYF